MQSDLNRLIATFDKMNNDGFDTDNYLKWGFFFIDKNENNLRMLFEELEGSGYKFESIREYDKDNLMLYVIKIDILSPEKLHKRNIAFNELAEHFSVSLYDGWDVEKI